MNAKQLRLLLSKSSSRILLIVSVLAAIIWSSLLIISAWLISDLIISIIKAKPIENLFVKLVIVWIFRSIFLALFENWTLRKAVRIKHKYRFETTSNKVSFRAISPAVMANLLTKGLNSLDIYMGRFIPQIIFASITPIMLIILLFFTDKLSAFIAILTLPLIPFFGALIGRYTADAVNRKWRTLSSLSGYFEDSLRGFATLKIFGRNTDQAKRIKEIGDKYTSETMKVLRISFLSSFALELVATISVALIAVSIGLRLVNGHIQFKSALLILILAPEIYFPLRNAAALFHASADGAETLDQIQKLPVKNSAEKIASDLLKSELITLGVGQRVFLVGDTGVGKTTHALKLLERYRDIAWIPQNPKLASGSIRDQFKLINPDIDDAQIIHLLDRVGLTVIQLPNGLDSNLEAGNELISNASGGQIRKIAIARALAKNAKFIIADEPTADLDPVSAATVMNLLRNQSAGLLVITHDLEVIRDSDIVVKMAK